MISNADRVRIQKELVLGAACPRKDTPEEASFRLSLSRDISDAVAKGIVLDIPLDWDEDGAANEFNPDELRDARGRWTAGASVSGFLGVEGDDFLSSRTAKLAAQRKYDQEMRLLQNRPDPPEVAKQNQHIETMDGVDAHTAGVILKSRLSGNEDPHFAQQFKQQLDRELEAYDPKTLKTICLNVNSIHADTPEQFKKDFKSAAGADLAPGTLAFYFSPTKSLYTQTLKTGVLAHEMAHATDQEMNPITGLRGAGLHSMKLEFEDAWDSDCRHNMRMNELNPKLNEPDLLNPYAGSSPVEGYAVAVQHAAKYGVKSLDHAAPEMSAILKREHIIRPDYEPEHPVIGVTRYEEANEAWGENSKWRTVVVDGLPVDVAGESNDEDVRQFVRWKLGQIKSAANELSQSDNPTMAQKLALVNCPHCRKQVDWSMHPVDADIGTCPLCQNTVNLRQQHDRDTNRYDSANEPITIAQHREMLARALASLPEIIKSNSVLSVMANAEPEKKKTAQSGPSFQVAVKALWRGTLLIGFDKWVDAQVVDILRDLQNSLARIAGRGGSQAAIIALGESAIQATVGQLQEKITGWLAQVVGPVQQMGLNMLDIHGVSPATVPKYNLASLMVAGATIPELMAKAQGDLLLRWKSVVRQNFLNGFTPERLAQTITAGNETMANAGPEALVVQAFMRPFQVGMERLMSVAIHALARQVDASLMAEGSIETVFQLSQSRLCWQWLSVLDEDVCPQCAELNWSRWDFDYEPLTNEDEEYEGDPPLHPNCFLGDTLVAPGGGVAAVSERIFQGNVVTVRTAHHNFTCTPNHPVLTAHGWVAAQCLKQGSRIVSYATGENPLVVKWENEHGKTTFKELFDSFHLQPNVTTAEINQKRSMFHGDGSELGECSVICSSCGCKEHEPSVRWPEHDHHPLKQEEYDPRTFFQTPPDNRKVCISHYRGCKYLASLLIRKLTQYIGLASSGFPQASSGGFCGKTLFQWRGVLKPFQHLTTFLRTVGLRFYHGFVFSTPTGTACDVFLPVQTLPDHARNKVYTNHADTLLDEGDTTSKVPYSNTNTEPGIGQNGDTKLAGDILDGKTGEIQFNDVLGVEFNSFHGPVYNCETTEHYYTANGIIVQNCRCQLVVVQKDDVEDLQSVLDSFIGEAPESVIETTYGKAAATAYENGQISAEEMLDNVQKLSPQDFQAVAALIEEQ